MVRHAGRDGTGRDGMAQGWREWLNAWKDLRIDASPYRELEEERVLVTPAKCQPSTPSA